jgi:glycosyltransferase involved in cell wall biosynthesis
MKRWHGVGGADDIITPDRDGILLNAADTLPRILRLLVDDPDLRRRLGDSAHKRARQLSWELTTRRIEAVYEEITRRKRDHR